MLQAAYAYRDITPEVGITLSGFAARCNRPSTTIDDHLGVRALALQSDKGCVLLHSFDLLGLGEELNDRIQNALDRAVGDAVPRSHRLLCCTHTHSAPATVPLLGCGIPDPAYWERVVSATVQVAEEAISRLQPARLRWARLCLPSLVYNRRRVLVDGRVVMSLKPDIPIAKVGPVRDDALLLRLESPAGQPIAGVIHWAAHPTSVCDSHITADYPGELCRRLAAKYAAPFLFLQGACGNLAMPFHDMTRAQMLSNIDRIMERLQAVPWSAPIDADASEVVSSQLALEYAPAMHDDELEAFASSMEQIASTGDGPTPTLLILANVMQVKPGKRPPVDLTRHIAGRLAAWARRWLNQGRRRPATCDLQLAAWRLGPIAWCFAAAELFAETALALDEAFPGQQVAVVGYTAPLVGYVPTDEAIREGGYEADHAYRFYNHPACFAPGSEPKVLAAMRSLVGQVGGFQSMPGDHVPAELHQVHCPRS